MHRFLLHILRLCLTGPLFLGGTGLYAQCEGPFNLGCTEEVTATLSAADCSLTVSPALVLNNLPACLADSNFVITVADDIPGNGAVVDGQGTFSYLVTGRHHPALTGFTCTGFLTVVDATPPEITVSAETVDRGCHLRDLADVNQLPPGTSRCWSVNGADGEVVTGSMDGRLRVALLAGGGIPSVREACGGLVEVCVYDAFDVASPAACVDTVRLQRSFTARNLAGNPNFAPAFSAQNIRFLRPKISQLQLPPEAIFNECPGGPVVGQQLPRPTDYPFFTTGNGPVHLNEGFCDLLVDYVDGAPIAGCPGNVSFVRTFRVRDWCSNGADTTFTQVVRIGDYRGPVIRTPTQDLNFDGLPDEGPLQFPTNTDQCSAVLDLLSGVSASDVCASSVTLAAYVFPGGDLTAPPLGPYPLLGGTTVGFSDPVPTGDHLLRYLGTDPCGNETIAEVSIRVTDGTPPTALCREEFTVTLNGAGFTTLPASVLDAGSSDDCSTVRLRVRRNGTNNTPIGQITLRCPDVPTTTVQLEVSDEAGNKNYCTTTINVTDAQAPFCTAPPPVELDCRLFTNQLPTTLLADFTADSVATGALLDAAFGAATGTDNCTINEIRQGLSGGLDECGAGQFVRTFTVVDASGNVPVDACRQVINVLPYTAYSLRFPGDRDYTCGDLPTPESIIGTGTGCDLLAVNTVRDTVSTGDPEACYTLSLTHEVINWCEYDGQSPAIQLPRDANNNGNLGEDLFVNVTTDGEGVTRAILDQDGQPNNGNDLGGVVTNYDSSPLRGHFSYVQIVGINDDEAPVVTLADPEAGLAFTDNCLGGVTINLTAADDCGVASVEVSIDELVTDLNGDNLFSAADFQGEYDIPESRFEGDVDAGLSVPVRNLPIGYHLARIVVTDGCGNRAERFTVLFVEDGRPPTLSCTNVLTVNLVPDATSGGIYQVEAGDFVAAPALTCTGLDVTYAIYTEAEASVPGFTPVADHTSLPLGCADLGENILRLYGFAERNGTNSFCNVALIVNDADELCADRMGEITGTIRTPAGEGVRLVEVFDQGPVTFVDFSDGAGQYAFDALEENTDHLVRPYLDRNPLNGVSTGDLNVIGRLLIGVEEELSPYQLIAADANNNGNITVHDLLMIRELVLGVEDDFDNNTSWRFIAADYVFPDPANPWLEAFPETILLSNLSGTATADFTAVKIGDVTGNANPQNNLSGGTTFAATRAGSVALTLRPADVPGVYGLFAPAVLRAGAAGAEEGITAVQAELSLPPGTRLLPGLLTPEEYHLAKENVLRLSHVATSERLDDSRPLLRFQLSGDELPQLRRVNVRLSPEAYTADFRTIPLTLRVAEAEVITSELLRASPNPFRGATVLTGQWPAGEAVTISVYDAAGQLVSRRADRALRGTNSWRLSAADLGSQSGLLLAVIRGRDGREESVRLIRR